ncbi:MAG: sterol desaturase family protein [Planctomycetales bacterium]|nr:sterol desaturase family protein [Planctomycetales bacterium]
MTCSLETAIRVTCFVGILLAMGVWEVLAPHRPLTVGKPLRWFSNLALVALNSVLVRLILPLSAVGTATLAEKHEWGLFNQLAMPEWIEFTLAVVLLDFTVYLQHVMSHAVPAFWRFHLVHHADLDFDVTTGLRFHTVEILVSMLLKIAVVSALGPLVWSVLVFEVLLNATSMFNHGNVRIPAGLDRLLRLFVVTPDMHRVHHSVLPHETNSNFGFSLPWWDFLMGTYHSQPAHGHDAMTIGLAYLRNERNVERLPQMLALPFRASAGDYAICARHTPSPDSSGNPPETGNDGDSPASA